MQFNFRSDEEFETKLRRLVELTQAPNKTAAIKAAVEEKLAMLCKQRNFDFKRVIGVAGTLRSEARFRSDDDLYRDQKP